MRLSPKRTRAIHPAFRGVGGLLAALVFALSLFAASPEAHRAVHPDAGHADHECAITMFAHGVEPGVATAQVVAFHAPLCAWQLAAPDFVRVGEPPHLRPFASGPPTA